MSLFTLLSDVQVRNDFDGSWVGGFQVIEVVDDKRRIYRIRRRSDRFVLPRLFSSHQLRPVRADRERVRRRLLV